MRSWWRLVAGGLGLVALLALGCSFAAPPVGAQVYVGVTPPEVGAIDAVSGASGVRNPASTAVGASTGARASTGWLALTGGDIIGLCVLGFGALGTGLVLNRVGRRASMA